MKSLRSTSLVIVQPLACITSFAALSACGQAMLPTVSRDNTARVDTSSAAELVPVKIGFQQAGLNLVGTALVVSEFSVKLLGGDACWQEVVLADRDAFKFSNDTQLKVVRNASGCKIELISFSQQSKIFTALGGNLILEPNQSKDFKHNGAAGPQTLNLTVAEGLNTATGGTIKINAGLVLTGEGSQIAGQQQPLAENGIGVSISQGEPPAITDIKASFTDTARSNLKASFTCRAQATATTESGLNPKEWCVLGSGVDLAILPTVNLVKDRDQKLTDYRAALAWLTSSKLNFTDIQQVFSTSTKISAVASNSPITFTRSGFSATGTQHTFASEFKVPSRPSSSPNNESPDLYLIVQNIDKGLSGYFIWKLRM